MGFFCFPDFDVGPDPFHRGDVVAPSISGHLRELLRDPWPGIPV